MGLAGSLATIIFGVGYILFRVIKEEIVDQHVNPFDKISRQFVWLPLLVIFGPMFFCGFLMWVSDLLSDAKCYTASIVVCIIGALIAIADLCFLIYLEVDCQKKKKSGELYQTELQRQTAERVAQMQREIKETCDRIDKRIEESNEISRRLKEQGLL